MGGHTVPLGKKLSLLLSPIPCHEVIWVWDGTIITATGLPIVGTRVHLAMVELPHDMVGRARLGFSILLRLAGSQNTPDITRMGLTLGFISLLFGDVDLHFWLGITLVGLFIIIGIFPGDLMDVGSSRLFVGCALLSTLTGIVEDSCLVFIIDGIPELLGTRIQR